MGSRIKVAPALKATEVKPPLVYRTPTELGLASVAVGSVTKHAPALKAIGTEPPLVYGRPNKLCSALEAVGSWTSYRGEASACLQEACRARLGLGGGGKRDQACSRIKSHRGEASSCLQEA